MRVAEGSLWAVLATGALAAGALGCNFQIPSPTYIHTTKLISVQGEVSELGPLNPARVGVGATPLAEAMPGDSYTFSMVVIDADGARVPDDELDSLWFQCGVGDCGGGGAPLSDALFDQRCDEIDDLTLDDLCELASGDGQTTFAVSDIGPELAATRVATFYGVVGFDGRSARSCWDARRAGQELFERCAFIYRPVKIGPSWWLLAHAETLDIESPIPVEQFPAPVYGQFANRVPFPEIDVSIDGVFVGSSFGSVSGPASFEASPGDRIAIEVRFNQGTQYLQSYFVAKQVGDSDSYWFEIRPELPTYSVFSTNSVHIEAERQFDGAPIVFIVDEYAEPARSQILVVYRDDRFGEGLAEIIIEVVP